MDDLGGPEMIQAFRERSRNCLSVTDDVVQVLENAKVLRLNVGSHLRFYNKLSRRVYSVDLTIKELDDPKFLESCKNNHFAQEVGMPYRIEGEVVDKREDGVLLVRNGEDGKNYLVAKGSVDFEIGMKLTATMDRNTTWYHTKEIQ